MLARQKSDILIEEFGDIIVEVAASFRIYTLYCGNYNNAVQLVVSLSSTSPNFKALLKVLINLKFLNLEIKCITGDAWIKLWIVPGKYLFGLYNRKIKPVQRICKLEFLISSIKNRYPLLLRELMKYTEPTSLDHETLAIANTEIGLVVQLVNQETQASGDKDRLISFLSKIEGVPVFH